MEIVLQTLIGILTLFLVYCLYQLLRNQKVYQIRMDWVNKNDSRWYKYTYEFMYDPSFRNWWGLKFPNEKDFQ